MRKLTTEEWVIKAKEVHGYKYDYSKVVYVNSQTKVTIICSEDGHGEFQQKANSHLSGSGCVKCSGSYTPTTEEWIIKARAVQGEKYDYSKVIYSNAHSKVTIICSEDGHGEFQQSANEHLKGKGCIKCSGKYQPTTDEWIITARAVHSDQYDYSKVNYVDSQTKVTIICPEDGHGEFQQKAYSHLLGFGCAKCSGLYVPTTEEWIITAISIHGNKYDYSKVVYVSSKIKVTIICPEESHGKFQQTPSEHLQGSGCAKCSGHHVPTTEEWIIKARVVHGDKYDYSKVNYVDGHTKVTIICPEHDPFQQTPHGHLQGYGCAKCSPLSDNDVVYIWQLDGVYHDGLPVYKIGVTSLRLDDNRLNHVANKAGFEVSQAFKYYVDGMATNIETELLKYGKKTDLGTFDGSTECRSLTELEFVNILDMLDNHEQLTKI